MFRWAALLGLIGLAVATGIIVWSGVGAVLDALAKAGWGILAVTAFHLVPLLVSAAGWRLLVPGKNRPSLASFSYYLWVRAAVNNLMPVARIGGEIACVRIMIAEGMRKSVAIASTVVELTLSVAATFVFVALGVLLFALRVNDHDLTTQLVWGLVLSAPLLGALIAVQRIGFFGLLSKVFRVLFRDKWVSITGSASRLDRAVTTIYRRKDRVVKCALWQFVSWSLGSVEIWLALYFLGHPLPILEAMMIEAMIIGSVSVAFAVPGALGVQEASFMIFGGMLGLQHEEAAALAVIRRCRDLIFYAPALILWQAQEGKRLLKL